VHEHTNKKVPSIAIQIYNLALGMQEENSETEPTVGPLENLGSHYVKQFVTWYNRRMVTMQKYLNVEEPRGTKRKRLPDSTLPTSNKKLKTLRRRMQMLRMKTEFDLNLTELYDVAELDILEQEEYDFDDDDEEMIDADDDDNDDDEGVEHDDPTSDEDEEEDIIMVTQNPMNYRTEQRSANC
jgi:hypothetical protein